MMYAKPWHMPRIPHGRSVGQKDGHSKGPGQSGPIQTVPESSVQCCQGISVWNRNSMLVKHVQYFLPAVFLFLASSFFFFTYNVDAHRVICIFIYTRVGPWSWSTYQSWLAMPCQRCRCRSASAPTEVQVQGPLDQLTVALVQELPDFAVRLTLAIRAERRGMSVEWALFLHSPY